MNLREALQSVYDSHDQLTPELVVQAARDPEGEIGAVLHSRFEWDDAVAGEAYRRQQAHDLIRSVRVVYKEATDNDDARSVRAFHAVRNEAGYAYEPLEKVSEDPFMKRMILAEMKREWLTLKRRYERFQEFTELVRQDLADAA